MNKENSKNYTETVRDKLTLSPIQKYIKYDRYPYKLAFSLILVLLTTLATYNLLSIYSISGQSQLKVWKNVLCLEETQDGLNHILSIQDFQSHLVGMLENFKNLHEILFQKIDNSETNYTIEVIPLFPISDLRISNKEIKNNSILSSFYENDRQIKNQLKENKNNNLASFFSSNYTYNVNLTEGIMKPFNMSSKNEIKSFLQRVQVFSFNVRNLKLFLNTPQGTVDYHTCWNIEVNYKFYMYSYILAETISSFFPCENVNETIHENIEEKEELYPKKSLKDAINFKKMEYSEKFMGDSNYTLYLAILFFASVSLILNLKYIYEIFQVYLQALINSKTKIIMTESIIETDSNDENDTVFKNKTSHKAFKTLEKLLDTDRPWHILTFREKLLFFDFWFVLGIAANLVQIWTSILALFQDIKIKDIIQILIGFSCFLSWLNIIRYLEYNKSIFTISDIMKRSLPQMLKFSLGFIPLFLAYVFLGISLFWRFESFKDANEATMTLFSLVMGDGIFTRLTTFNQFGLVSLLYFFSFLIIFFMAIQNIFVSIICSKAKKARVKDSVLKEKERIEVQKQQSQKAELIFKDLMKIDKRPILKKACSFEGNITTPTKESKNWSKKNTLLSPTKTKEFKDAQYEANPLLISTAYKKTLKRRPQNPNAFSNIKEDGALSKILRSIPIKKYKTLKKDLKDIEMILFEKDRLLDEFKYLTETALVWLDDMYRDNVTDLKFYKLRLKERIEITNEYLNQLKGLSLKVKDMRKKALIIN